MTDSNDEGPGDKKSGPLRETFPEFIRYARDRQKKSQRQTPPPPPRPRARSPATVRQALKASAAVVSFLIVWVALRALTGPWGHKPTLATVKVHTSVWIDLPRPPKFGEVPDGWGALRLGMKMTEVPEGKRAAYTSPDHWADSIYTPDPAKADAFLGLSFYNDRLYKLGLRLGEDSPYPAGLFLVPAGVAYGHHRGYEYPTIAHPHVVTIFQTGTLALKLDCVKRDEDTFLSEVTLVDLEAGAARELARARGR